MTRPTTLPEWATNANHAAGVEDWSGQPTKVEPSSGEKAAGFIPQEQLPAEYENWLHAEHAKLLAHLDGRDVTRMREDWIGKAIAAATADPIVNFSKWKVTVDAGGGIGLVSTSDDYNGPFAAMSGFDVGVGVLLETTIPVCRRADDSVVRFDFDVALGSTDIDDAVAKFGLKDSTTDFAQFYFDQFVNANWQVQSRDGTTTTTDDTGEPPDAASYPNHRFSIVLRGANVGDSIEYYIDDELVATHAGTEGPRDTANLTVFFDVRNDGAGAGSPEMKIGAGLVDWNRR